MRANVEIVHTGTSLSKVEVPAFWKCFQSTAEFWFQLTVSFEDCRSLMQAPYLAFEAPPLQSDAYLGSLLSLRPCRSATALWRGSATKSQLFAGNNINTEFKCCKTTCSSRKLSCIVDFSTEYHHNPWLLKQTRMVTCLACKWINYFIKISCCCHFTSVYVRKKSGAPDRLTQTQI